jgi:hypothetical protein
MGKDLQVGETSRAIMSQDSFLKSKEFILTLLVVIGMCSLFMLGLNLVGEFTRFLLLDFREWTPSASTLGSGFTKKSVLRYYESIQTRISAQRPLRVTLQLMRPPQPGDSFSVEKVYSTDPSQQYCFEVFAFGPYSKNDSKEAIDSFGIKVRVNGDEVASIPIAESEKVHRIVAKGIWPVDRRIKISFSVEVHSMMKTERWKQASTVHFENASLRPCWYPD